MFRRLFWLVAGGAIGVWGTTKVNRAARRLTPEGLVGMAAVNAAELGERLRQFTDDVRAGMAEREAELGRALGLPASGQVEALHPAVRHQVDIPQTQDRDIPGQCGGIAYDRKDER